MQTHDPLEEIDLGYRTIKKPIYITVKVYPILKIQMTELLKEFKDYFAWHYDKITRLNKKLVEFRLLI